MKLQTWMDIPTFFGYWFFPHMYEITKAENMVVAFALCDTAIISWLVINFYLTYKKGVL